MPLAPPSRPNSSAKERLLARLKASGADAEESPSVNFGALGRREAITRASARPHRIPLTPVQAGLWYLEQVALSGSLYNMPVALRLDGDLDEPVLRRALDALVERHESLRTSFHSEGGEIWQEIHPPGRMEWAFEDRSSGVDAESTAELLAVEATRPFVLTDGNLVRCRLVKLAPRSFVLMMVLHHLIADGGSLGIITRELGQLYSAFTAGRSAALPAKLLDFPDYALWLAQRGGRSNADHLDYWRTKLTGVDNAVAFVTADRSSSTAKEDGAGACKLVLSKEVSSGAESLARHHGVTPFVLFLTLFDIVLHSWTGEADLVVGSTVAGRARSEVQDVLGMFVNMVPLRSSYDAAATFEEMLHENRATLAEALARQDYPFEALVAGLNPRRVPGRHPIFQIMINYQDYNQAQAEFAGLNSEIVLGDNLDAKFDLSIYVRNLGGQIELATVFRETLHDKNVMRAMLTAVEEALAQTISHPDLRIEQIIVCSSRHAREVTHIGEGPVCALPTIRIHEPFERWERELADATAVSCGPTSLSYGELGHRIGQLTSVLVELGLGPQSRVGVHLERSVDLIAALYAVLRCGACYVPLDPRLPLKRTCHIASETKCAAIITQTELIDPAPSLNVPRIEIDRLQWSTIGLAAIGILTPANAEAYITYTSGSAGGPKGVPAKHVGAANYLADFISALGLRGDDVILNFSTFAFDASVRDLFTPGWLGAKLVLLDPNEVGDPEAIARRVVAEGVTVIPSMVPSFVGPFLEALARQNSAKLRILATSGERLSLDLARRAFELFPHLELVNQYGPTEATMTVTRHRVGSEGSDGPIPIGRPISNVRLSILDSCGRILPRGVPGELHISGPGLTDGYIERAAETALRFHGSVSGEAGDRMYRSGDIVRWRSDGELEFLHRRDRQLKVRGHRIEPEEIEGALIACGGIDQAVVAVHGDGADARILAYYRGPGEGPRGWREHLAGSLPSHMIPSALIQVSEFPRTSSGKVDLQKLLETNAVFNRAIEEARTPTELVLSSIWKRVLGLDAVGVHDDFFEIGGHSLLAVKLLVEMNAAAGREVALRDFLREPTIAAVAATMDRAQAPLWGDSTIRPIPLRAGSANAYLVLLHAIDGTLFSYRGLLEHLDADATIIGFEAPGFSGTGKTFASVEALAEAYAEALRGLPGEAKITLCGWSFGGMVAHELGRLLEMGGRVANVVMIDTSAPGLWPHPDLDHDLKVQWMWFAYIHLGEENVEDIFGNDEFWTLSHDERLSQIGSAIRSKSYRDTTGRPPPELSVEELRVRFACIQGLARAIGTYRPTSSGQRLVHITASASKITNPATGDSISAADYWMTVSDRGLERVEISGDHQSIMRGADVAALAHSISALVDCAI